MNHRMRLWHESIVVFILIFCLFLPVAQSQPPVTIGATVSLDGKYWEPSLMIKNGYQLWVEEVNQRGGLLGRKVKLILYNDKSDREETRKLYKRLIEEDKVDFVLSPYSTPLNAVASEITEKHQKIMLAVAAASTKPWQRGYRYLFQVYAPADRQFIGLLDMMAKKGLNTLAVLHDDKSNFNVDNAQGIRAWAKLFKIKILLDRSFQDGKKELPELLQEVRSKDPTGLFISAYPPDLYELIHLLEEKKYRPRILGMPIVPAHPDFQKKVGKMADHVLGPSQWEPMERIPFPGTKRFVEAFTRFAKMEPSFHAAAAFSACQLLEQAIVNTGSFNHEKLREYMAALDTVTVLGRFKVDISGKQVGHNSFIIQWQNGKKEIVWPVKMQTAKPIL